MFSEGEYKPKGWIGDLFGGRREKDLHDWQQSLAESIYLVETFSSPGDLLVDLLMGSAANAVSRYTLNSRFVGADEDAEASPESSDEPHNS